MKDHELYFLTAQMYLAAAMAVEQMSFAAVCIGTILGALAIYKCWRH